MRSRAVIVAILVGFGTPSSVSAQESIRFVFADDWRNLESEKEQPIRFKISSFDRFSGRLIWTASIGGISVGRGEAPIELAAAENRIVSMKLTPPQIRSGLFVRVAVDAALILDKGGVSTAKASTTYWVLPSDPFADRREWAKSLKLVLYDPKRLTAEVLTKADIPYRQQHNLASLIEEQSQLFVIGEGVSWKSDPELFDIVVKLAQRGSKVLCLAPEDGTIPFPVSKKATKGLRLISARSNDVIGDWDKRLDSHSWQGEGNPIAKRVAIRFEKSDVVGMVGDNPEGWAWIEARFENGGVFVVCGFGLMRSWTTGPTPRFVFLRALESLGNTKE